MKTLVLLPAYNEGSVIYKVIKSIRAEGYKEILVVNDGSQDNTVFEAKKAGAKVVSHFINLGQGAATFTGLEYAKIKGYDYVIIMDSDGQHNPKDINSLVDASKYYDVVIGSRMLNNKAMPLQRKIANTVGSLITWIFFGLYVTDSQSGLKIFNRKALNKIKITFDNYEFCSEIIGEIHYNKLTYKEVSIKVLYTKYSMNKKNTGQSIINGFKMIFRFAVKRFLT